MRVAFKGNHAPTHSTETHLAGSFEALGHEVVRLQENTVSWVDTVRAARRSDLFLWTKTWSPDQRGAAVALAQLRARGIPTASFHLDRWWGLDREHQIKTDPFFRTDVVFTADGGHQREFEEAGVNHRWLPPGVFRPECEPGVPDPTAWPHEVVFVGSHPYPHREWEPTRTAMLHAVHKHLGYPRFAVLPNGLVRPAPQRSRPRPAVRGQRPPGNPAIRGDQLRSLYATAKIVIGDSCLAGGATRYSSDRIPESLGRGAFLIHPHVEGITDGMYEAGVHLETFDHADLPGLCDKIDFYLAHDTAREKIAQAGRELVLARDTYEHRAATILREMGLT